MKFLLFLLLASSSFSSDQYRVYHSQVCSKSMSVKVVNRSVVQVKLFDQAEKTYHFRFCGRMFEEKVCQYESPDGDYIDMAKTVNRSKSISFKYQGCTFRLKN